MECPAPALVITPSASSAPTTGGPLALTLALHWTITWASPWWEDWLAVEQSSVEGLVVELGVGQSMVGGLGVELRVGQSIVGGLGVSEGTSIVGTLWVVRLMEPRDGQQSGMCEGG